ncbi:hypothetical protein, partial [Rhodanobacter sp. 115]
MSDLLSQIRLAVDAAAGGYLGKTISDIIQCEKSRNSVAEKYPRVRVEGGEAFACDADDRHLLNYMPQLERLYVSILTNDDPPVIATSAWRTKKPGFKLSKLGERIFLACRYFSHREGEGRDWKSAYAHHEFHPVISVLFRSVMRWWATIGRWGDTSRVLIEGEPDTVAVEGLCSFVEFVRSTCRSQAFKNLLYDHERKAGSLASGVVD